MRIGKRHFAGAALIAAVAIGALAAIGLASGATTKVSKAVTIPGYNGSDESFPSATAAAHCPKGFKPQSGGWVGSVDANPLDGNAEILTASVAFKAGAWKVHATNEGQAAGQLKATATCGKQLPHVFAVRKKGTVKPEANATATATCPKGSEVLRGGFAAADFNPQEGGANVYGAKRTTNRSWKVYAEGAAPTPEGPSSPFSATAYCGKGPKVKTASAVASVPPGEKKSVTAKCPPGTKVLFGSAIGDVDAVNQTKAVIVVAQRSLGKRRWSADGIDLAVVPDSGKLRVFAYCS